MAQDQSDLLAALEVDLRQPVLREAEARKTAEMRAHEEPVAERSRAGDMPPIVLAAAGLAVFDTIICLVYVTVWVFSPPTLLAIIHAMAGVSLLVGVSPIVVAGYIFSKNRQAGVELPGTPFAVWAMVSGAVMMTLTLAVPMVAAIQALTTGGGS